MSWFFEENLAEFAPYRDEQPRDGFQIIGTSGTVTTVAASHLELKRYDRTKVDGLRMTSDQIDRVINSYLALGGRAATGSADRQRPAGFDHVGIGHPASFVALLANRASFSCGSRFARGFIIRPDEPRWRIRGCTAVMGQDKKIHLGAVSVI